MLKEESKKFLRALKDPEWDAYLDYLDQVESGEYDEPNIGRKIEEPYRGKLEEAE